MIKNIGENITNGKFKPDGKGGLIQNLNDLAAFRKLFGEYKDAKNVIANVMSDLSGILARDKFYNRLIQELSWAKSQDHNCYIGTDASGSWFKQEQTN